MADYLCNCGDEVDEQPTRSEPPLLSEAVMEAIRSPCETLDVGLEAAPCSAEIKFIFRYSAT